MTQVTQQLKQGVGQAIESLSDGWRDLWSRAGEALTRFRSVDRPVDKEGEHHGPPQDMPSLSSWAFMAADVFDDDDRLTVRVEAPGMRREDLQIELVGDTLRILGEKRLDRETRRGGHSIVQSAYGSFRRDVALPAAVRADQARATYRDGVLRIELPKAEAARRKRITVKVH